MGDIFGKHDPAVSDGTFRELDKPDGFADLEPRIRPEIEKLAKRGNVTPAEVAELRCNSWEWELIIPAMNDEAFVNQMQRALDNCFTTRRRPFSTYNEAVEGLYAPELIRRFRDGTRFEFSKLVQACKNIGFDLMCGRCAEVFFTGFTKSGHDDTCGTSIGKEAEAYAETIDGVREALGQEATHYLIIAGDVQELVEAVERSSEDGGVAAREKLLEFRERGKIQKTLSRTPDGFINNCALANSDEEKNCQMCAGQCPDRSRLEAKP